MTSYDLSWALMQALNEQEIEFSKSFVDGQLNFTLANGRDVRFAGEHIYVHRLDGVEQEISPLGMTENIIDEILQTAELV